MSHGCACGERELITARRLASVAAVALVLVAVAASSAQAGSGSLPQHSHEPLPEHPPSLTTPPPGGITMGLAGTGSLDALIEAQAFPVQSVATFHLSTQRVLIYIPGAPAFVNTLADHLLTPDTVVVIRHAGDLERTDGERPSAEAGTVPLSGTPSILLAPPPGGITLGVAGTNDVQALIAAQPFEVRTLATFDIESQLWLTYVVGAPSIANTLGPASLDPGSVVVMQRAAPVALPPAEPAGEALKSSGVARISYYFCERGSDPAGWGDGGGFCGYMSSGVRVYEGGAACAPELRGQRFRIDGDPLDRAYTCDDTGGAVRGNTRDIFFHNSDDALRWWRAVGPEAEIFIVE